MAPGCKIHPWMSKVKCLLYWSISISENLGKRMFPSSKASPCTRLSTQRSGVLTELWTAPVVDVCKQRPLCISVKWHHPNRPSSSPNAASYSEKQINRRQIKKEKPRLSETWVSHLRGKGVQPADGFCLVPQDGIIISHWGRMRKNTFLWVHIHRSQNIKKINNNRKEQTDLHVIVAPLSSQNSCSCSPLTF